MPLSHFSPQGLGNFEEVGPRRFYKPDVVCNSKKTMFFRHPQADAHVSSQRLWKHTQSCTNSSYTKPNPAWGRSGHKSLTSSREAIHRCLLGEVKTVLSNRVTLGTSTIFGQHELNSTFLVAFFFSLCFLGEKRNMKSVAGRLCEELGNNKEYGKKNTIRNFQGIIFKNRHQKVAWVCGKRKFYLLLGGIQTCTTSMEVSVWVLQKPGTWPTAWSISTTLWHTTKGL